MNVRYRKGDSALFCMMFGRKNGAVPYDAYDEKKDGSNLSLTACG